MPFVLLQLTEDKGPTARYLPPARSRMLKGRPRGARCALDYTEANRGGVMTNSWLAGALIGAGATGLLTRDPSKERLGSC